MYTGGACCMISKSQPSYLDRADRANILSYSWSMVDIYNSLVSKLFIKHTKSSRIYNFSAEYLKLLKGYPPRIYEDNLKLQRCYHHRVELRYYHHRVELRYYHHRVELRCYHHRVESNKVMKWVILLFGKENTILQLRGIVKIRKQSV